MKKLSLLMMLVLGFSFASAQKSGGTNWVKVGIHAGIPAGDASDASNFAFGLDAKYQFLNYRSFGIGFATGYTNYFSKDIDGIDNKDFGLVPLAALFRYYPKKNFFIGINLGYGFEVGGKDDYVYTDKLNKEKLSGGFYYRPELGYHSKDWNIFGYFEGVSSDLSPANVGVGLNYNLIQGK